MTVYRFRVWLFPNPPLEFEPESDVWKDIEVDESPTRTAYDFVPKGNEQRKGITLDNVWVEVGYGDWEEDDRQK